MISRLTRHDSVAATDAVIAIAIGRALRDLLDEWGAGRFDVTDLLGDDEEGDDLLGGLGADWFLVDEDDRLRGLGMDDRRN